MLCIHDAIPHCSIHLLTNSSPFLMYMVCIDNWYRGVVPPNSHLCFEVEVLKIAESPLEEFDMKLTEFGKPRAAAAAFLTTYLALSPFIHLPGSDPQFPVN